MMTQFSELKAEMTQTRESERLSVCFSCEFEFVFF